MKLLDRYVVREMLVPLFTGTVVIALLFVGNDMIAIFKNFNVQAVPKLAILQLLLFKFPYWFSLTLPIGAAMGASLAVSRLARESELTAMRASGIRVTRVFRPAVLVGCLIALVNFWVVDTLIPASSKAYKQLIADVGLLATAPMFQSNVTVRVSRYMANFGSIQRRSDGTMVMQDVLLFERPRAGEKVIYSAKSGTYRDGHWRFQEPESWWFKDESVHYARKGTLTIEEPIRIADLFMPPQPEEESVRSLRAAIAQNRASGISTTSLEIAMHQKFAISAACAVFAFSAAIFSAKLSRSGPFVGLLVSIAIVVTAFNLHVVSGEIVGRYGWLPPALAAWSPNILFVGASLLFMRRLE